MTAQRVIWTACPNGTAPNGNLRISVAVGPQLMPTGTGATLADFPDWEDWPATQITWKATIGTARRRCHGRERGPVLGAVHGAFPPDDAGGGLPVPEPDGQRPLHLPCRRRCASSSRASTPGWRRRSPKAGDGTAGKK